MGKLDGKVALISGGARGQRAAEAELFTREGAQVVFGDILDAASKGAIRIFTKVTASQHAQDRIRCNSVHPGPIDTEMLHAAMPDPAVLKRRLERVPLGRMGTVDEVVRLVLYLASDESAYMTGSELVIDGGALAQ